MKLSFRAAAVAVVSLSGLPATTGCGDDGGDATDTRVPDATDGNDATDGADGTATDTPDGETSAATGDIEGRWAMLEVQSALVTTALLGTQTQTSTSYYLADLADGTMTVTLCDWRTEDTSGLTRTRMGDSVLANLDPFVRDYSVTADGDGFLFAAADGFALRGVELANPATDPMPTDAGDSHVVDQDSDGKPGITLVVQGTVVLLTGATIGEHAVLLHGRPNGRHVLVSRAIRLLAGIGGYTVLLAMPTPIDLLAPVLALASVAAVLASPTRRGLATTLAGMELVDRRA